MPKKSNVRRARRAPTPITYALVVPKRAQLATQRQRAKFLVPALDLLERLRRRDRIDPWSPETVEPLGKVFLAMMRDGGNPDWLANWMEGNRQDFLDHMLAVQHGNAEEKRDAAASLLRSMFVAWASDARPTVRRAPKTEKEG